MRNTRAVTRRYTVRNYAAMFVLVVGAAGPQAGKAAADDIHGMLFRPQPLPISAADPLPTLAMSPAGANDAATTAPPTGAIADAGISGDDEGASAALASTIQSIEEDDGPYAPGLVPHLLALARLRQRQQDHAAAIAAASRAAQILRAGSGLDTPQQFPAIEIGIASHLALQDYQQALEQQRALLHLHRSFYGPAAPELVPRLLTLGDMYFAAFERGLYRAPGGSGLTMMQGAESGHADPERLSNEDVAFLWLVQAQNSYVEAIEILLKLTDYANPLLLTLEGNVVETLFLQAHRRELERDPEFFLSAVDTRTRSRDLDYEAAKKRFHGDGEQAYLRMLAYQRAAPNAQVLQIARTMLQLGDWHVLFGRYTQGREVYQQTRRFLQDNEVEQAAMDLLLMPAVPPQLPEFLDQPHSLDAVAGTTAADVSFEGYIDVAFTLSQSGTVTSLNVLDSSPTANRQIEARLRKVLRNAPFRPRIGPEAESGSSEFELRYSFARL